MFSLLLRNRNFALLWLAGLISLMGDRAMLTALPFYVYLQTGSTIATAIMMAAYYLPAFLLGSVAGVFVDRWNRKRIMVVANLIQTVVMLLLLLVRTSNWIWIAYLVTFLEISISMFFGPAEESLLPNLVREDELVSANALNSLNNNIARLVGPPIGGALISFLSLSSVAIVDSASFLFAAVLISFIAAPAKPIRHGIEVAGEAVSSWVRTWREWLEGLRLVRVSRPVLVLFIVFNVTSLGGSMLDPLFAPWVKSVLHGDATVMGLISTVGAVGGLLSGLLVAQFGKRFQPWKLLSYGIIAVGLMMAAVYNQTAIPNAMALGFLLNVILVWEGVGAQTLVQTSVPDSHRGRVFGALNTTNALVGLAAVGISGFFGQLVGIVPMLNVAASITVIAGVIALVLLPNRARRSQPADEISATP